MPSSGSALSNDRDDDYVIGLLKKDAVANQKRYLSSGLGSLLSRKPAGNAPKPNKTFLKNIIRETNSHNAAIKAKEEEDSRAKLKELRGAKRGREDGDIAEEGSSKRRRGEEKQGRWANVLGGLSNGARGGEKRHKERDAHGEKERGQRRYHDRGKRRSENHGAHRHRKKGEEKVDLEPEHNRSSSHRKEHRRRRSSTRSHSPSESPPKSTPRRNHDGANDDSASDPLETFFGPKPPPQTLPRGRGAFKASGIETRFAPSYDPKSDVDVEQDEDRDDWDMALEALRDRAKWRKSGAERLKAAGFTEDEVKKWEKGGGGGGDEGVKKDFEDIRWSKAGEKREWDRGKVVDQDGRVDVKADWA